MTWPFENDTSGHYKELANEAFRQISGATCL